MGNAVLASNAARTGELEQTRKSLYDAISNNPDLTQDFSWAQQALHDRTELFVDRYLRENQPGMLTWCQIGEHLRALGYQLDQCQARQEKLFELESNCLSAVIDCLNADQLFAIDQDLEIVQVKAQAINEPPEQQAELVQRVKDKFAIKRDLFAYRKSFFSAPRGPLNFNQRILFLRRLQADSIHAVYQRAITIRHALKCNAMASLDPVPSWSTGDNDSLDDLILWARKAIDAVENYISLERQHDVCISSVLYPEFFTRQNGEPMTWSDIPNLLREKGYDEIFLNFARTAPQSRGD